MKYKLTIYGLSGTKIKYFDDEESAYNAGENYLIYEDWTAIYEVKEVK